MYRTNLVLFYCGLRTGHFGQGTFIQNLLPYFKKRPDILITLIKTDCSGIAKVVDYKEDGVEIMALPRMQKGMMLTGENNPAQKMYSQRIIGMIYPYLKDKANLLFWANSIDYLNVFYDLRQVFQECKLNVCPSFL
jgi:hypothetical protein